MPKTQSRQLYVSGFDPGGQGNFGWCVARCTPWKVIAAGCADNADDALNRVRDTLNGACIAAAGIDAPLYWSRKGLGRESDIHIRKQMKKAQAPNPHGTVQAVNSLRGACLAQGIMLALVIEKRFPKCMITETHPKALLACEKRLPNCYRSNSIAKHEMHKRDAEVSAWVAAQTMGEKQKWQNLFLLEKDKSIHRFLKKTYYWWMNE